VSGTPKVSPRHWRRGANSVARCLPVAFLSGIVVTLGATSVATATSTTTTLPTVTYNRACEASAQTQLALDKCAGSELRQLDAKLTIALKRERRRVPSKLVNAAQKAFVSYESSECRAAASVNSGGSIYPLVFDQCGIRLTVQRIQQVESDA
jgi:uncharacterized protein YecT (DUF1311 family)